MRDFVAYHNADKMGYSYRQAKDPLAFVTRKGVNGLPGSRVWAIAGEGQPREYFLGAWFIVDEVVELGDDPSVRTIRGRVGELFDPMIRINAMPWFPRFRQSQSNFSLGLQPISDEFVPLLEDAVAHAMSKEAPLESLDVGPDLTDVPSASRYASALSRLEPTISSLLRRLLEVHHQAPGRAATAVDLAANAGLAGGYPVVNLHYGRLGAQLCRELMIDPGRRDDGTSRWWRAMATGWRTPQGFMWKMRPNLAEALESLGWVEPTPPPISLMSVEHTTFVEGTAQEVLATRYERNPAARCACISHYGPRCVVCGFDFEHAYGPVGAGFIHVHHLVPLSAISGAHEVVPVRDLRPVCANCHAVIHLRDPPYTIAEVQGFIRAAVDGSSS